MDAGHVTCFTSSVTELAGIVKTFMYFDNTEGILFYYRLDSFRKNNETDSDFARRLGVSRAVFNGWKNGSHLPKRKTFDRIMDTLDVMPVEFWSGCSTCSYNQDR